MHRTLDALRTYLADNLDIVDKVLYFLLSGLTVFLPVDLGHFYPFLSSAYSSFNSGHLQACIMQSYMFQFQYSLTIVRSVVDVSECACYTLGYGFSHV